MKTMKATVCKVRRSGIYYLMTTIAPVNEVRSARFDIWGAAVVVTLLVGVVGLMRVILTA
jgi:hypothetical protein